MKILHNVQAFETIENIANQYDVPVEVLKRINNIENTLPGYVEIPVSNEDFCVVKNAKRNLLINVGNNFNFIKLALSKVGFLTKTTSAEQGDKVLFTKKENNVYVVGVLETLASICNKFNLNIEDVKQKNNLKTEKLFIGQMLKL